MRSSVEIFTGRKQTFKFNVILIKSVYASRILIHTLFESRCVYPEKISSQYSEHIDEVHDEESFTENERTLSGENSLEA